MQNKVKDIINYLKATNIKEVTLGFSTGKDSVVATDIMLQSGINVIPFYFYIVPGLKFIADNLKLYEKHFNIKVIQMPHPICKDHIRHADWQPLHRAIDMGEYNIPVGKFDVSCKWYLQRINKEVKYDVVGLKEADSINRRLLLRNYDYIHGNKIYPVKKFTQKDIEEYLRINNIPITNDYKIFGRSWDGLYYHFLVGVKKYYPEDFETIKKYYPLIEIEIFRYEQNRRQRLSR